MSRVTKSDPNDWAKKRKEAMDRAKQLREERKHGMGEVDDNHTFKPQINKRPQYLKKEEQSIENVPYRDPNDVFEKPLPGGKGQYQFDSSSEQPLSSTPQPLSSYIKQNNNNNNSYSNNNNQIENRNGMNKGNQNIPENGYKSKFMQQYDQNNHNNQNNQNNQNQNQNDSYQPPQRSKADVEAEDTFMNLLRGNSNSQNSGWNDSTDASIPALPKKVSYRRRKPTDQNQPQNTSSNSISSRPSPRQKSNEWNSDFGNGIPPLAPSQQYLRRDNIQSSPSNINRGGMDNSDSVDVSQARSRLSLLKSKMRKADSGSDLRSLSANERERERQRPQNQRNHNDWDSSPADDNQYIPNLQPKGGRRQQQQSDSSYSSDYDHHHHNNNNNHNGYENQSSSNRRVGQARQQLSQQQNQQNQYPQDDYNQPPPRRQNSNPSNQNQRPQQQQQQQQPAYQSAYDEENDYDDNYGGGRGQGPNSVNSRNNNNNNNNNAFMNDPNLEEDIGLGEQLECPDCGRKFNRIPYEKHVKICNKIFGQKRKVFDSKKMRMVEELEKYQQEEKQKNRFNKKKGTKQQAASNNGSNNNNDGDNRPVQGEKTSKWKEQSKQFREAMKMARLAKKAEETGGPMPEYVPSAPDPSLIRCQHCGRSFNERAAERHIPLCSNIKAKPTSLKRGSGGAGGKTGTVSGSVSLGTSNSTNKPAPRRR